MNRNKQIEKQQTGFRFGKYKTKLIRVCGEKVINGRTYRFVLLETSDGLLYYAWRLYNSTGRFIKQFLFEPQMLSGMTTLMLCEIKNEQKKVRHKV